MHIAFDADDTLWHNEPLYNLTQDRVASLLSEWVDSEQLDQRLVDIERRNLRLFGYGAKGFSLSLIETAIEVTEGRVSAAVIQQILDAGKSLIEQPIELLPGVRETVSAMAAEHPLMLITKGDLFDQESKLARSGLAELFDTVEVVSEKDPETYRKVLDAYNIDAERFVMIGNSVKSDILPVVAVGGNAIHIPYESQWELDKVEHRGADAEGFFVATTVSDVPEVLQRIVSQGWTPDLGATPR